MNLLEELIEFPENYKQQEINESIQRMILELILDLKAMGKLFSSQKKTEINVLNVELNSKKALSSF